jgi:hypothetical protein
MLAEEDYLAKDQAGVILRDNSVYWDSASFPVPGPYVENPHR